MIPKRTDIENPQRARREERGTVEEIEQQLREQLARETLKIVLDGLRDGAEIEIVPQSAEATGEAAPEPAPAQ